MYLDIALSYDPAARQCDLVYDGRRLVLDLTPATPLLASIGGDRRAEADDTLPDGTTEGSLQAGFNARRGWAGDSLGGGQRAGSRLWLLERAKQDEATRQAAEDYAVQAAGWIGVREGAPVACMAAWAARNVLGLRVAVGASTLRLQVPVGA